jgi:hypothetical protein
MFIVIITPHADMNRNFGFHWNEGGSSANGCSDTFHGGAAFSEIESQHVRDAILAVAGQAEMYLTFHSYGQYWLTPWGYTSALPDDYTQLVRTLSSLAQMNSFSHQLVCFSTPWLYQLSTN